MASRTGGPTKAEEAKEAEAKVEKYEERPYSEAISDEHRKYLKDIGVPVETQTAEVPAE